MFDPCIRPALAPAPAPVLAPPSALQSLVRFFPRLVLLLALLAAPAIAPAQGQAEVDALSRALGRVAAEDWDGAAQAAQGAGELVGDLVAWHRLRAGAGTLGEYEDFLLRRPDWPGLPFLKQSGEAAAARSTTPDRVIGYFGTDRPGTPEGALAQIAALTAAGRAPDADAVALQAWRELSFDAAEQAAMLEARGTVLSQAHEQRLDRLLWRGASVEARRMLPLVGPGWQALAQARIALRENTPGVTALIEAVPSELANDPGLAFERAQWRARRDLTDDAAALIRERSTSAAALGDPAAWADRRASVARVLMRDGKAAEAYEVAARHFLTEGADYADLEFLSGFIALRKLDDPARALDHFTRLQAAVGTPISLSRALYWQGRAREAAGDGAGADAAFQAAARHQTAYYGLLAAERLGLTLDQRLLSQAPAADWRGAGFAGSSVLAAGRLLLAAGQRTLGKRFLLHLAESLDADELDQLAGMALELDEPHVALLIAKAAAERGAILPNAYFPISDLVPEDGLSVSRALALAISRRESEFDPAARSPADARGLMQLLPGTAKMMAAKLDLPHDVARLTTDPAYNARLGTAYLRQLVDEFGPSIALVASGYNAGPGRPRRWIEAFGDPRNPDVDVIDWVETIPFTETRTYVMRVVESLVIYRARLKGAAGPVDVTGELRG